MKIENKLNNKFAKGFTLLELLVVVVIIGILAAIALPQYKLAVAKSRYSTLKNTAKSLKESADRYYLLHSSYPTKFDDLDIGFSVKKTDENPDSNYFSITFSDDNYCTLNYSAIRIVCVRNINNVRVDYLIDNRAKRECKVYSVNTSDILNRICQSETGKTAEQASCSYNYCSYYY